MGNRFSSFVTTGAADLMAFGIFARPRIDANLFIRAKETDILRLVAHTWLIFHTLNNKKELWEQRKRSKPFLYTSRTVLNGFLAVGSGFAAANALWHLMS